MNIKSTVDPSDYKVGAIVCRLQVHELHAGHVGFFNLVCANHKKVIVFLGVPVIQNTRNNPLDFATRSAMVMASYPNVVVLPLKDQRSDILWSQELDRLASMPYGEQSVLLYGSRDSFIPHYYGKHKTAEVETDVYYSGTEVRKLVSQEILQSSDFRAGVIHANYARRDVTYPTVDIVAYNEKGQILLARKPNEDKLRFVGGFVDRGDNSYEQTGRREFMEETGGIADGLVYVASQKIDDWRYKSESDGIMTTLFLGKFIQGPIKPNDDIASLEWVYPEELIGKGKRPIMEEHEELMKTLLASDQFKKLVLSQKQLA